MGPNIKIKKCNYNLHDGRIGGCGAWDARGCWMWSMPEGRQCEPRELAKGPESAIGQRCVGREGVRTTPTDEEKAERELRRS